MTPTTPQWIAAALFGIALLHTFAAKHFERLSHRFPRHAGLLHLSGEVEVVFVDMAPGFFRTIGTAPTRLTSASTGDETKLRVRRGAQQVFACAAHRLFSIPDVIGLNFSPVFP